MESKLESSSIDYRIRYNVASLKIEFESIRKNLQRFEKRVAQYEGKVDKIGQILKRDEPSNEPIGEPSDEETEYCNLTRDLSLEFSKNEGRKTNFSIVMRR